MMINHPNNDKYHNMGLKELVTEITGQYQWFRLTCASDGEWECEHDTRGDDRRIFADTPEDAIRKALRAHDEIEKAPN